MIGIASNDEFELELNKLSVNSSTDKQYDPNADRGLQTGNNTSEFRALIAQEALNGTPREQIMREFKVSSSSIDAYRRGHNTASPERKLDDKLRERNKIFRHRIVSKASLNLTKSLDAITEDKLRNCDAKENAQIAKDMSVVIKNMSAADEDKVMPAAIIIHAPQVRSIDEFHGRTIDISAIE